MHPRKPDPSYASNRLTRGNYPHKVHLLKTVNGRSSSPTAQLPTPSKMPSSTEECEVDEELDRPPDSSGDDEERGSDTLVEKIHARSSPRPLAPTPAQSRKPVRSFRTSRARSGKIKDQEDLGQLSAASDLKPEEDELYDNMLSQSKRRCTDYSQRRKATGAVLVPKLPSQPQVRSHETDFYVPGIIEDSSRQSNTSHVHDSLQMPAPFPTLDAVYDEESTLNVPAVSAPNPVSSSTSAADSFLALEMPDSPMDRTFKRSRSSSLSSVNSLASLQLARGVKDAMLQDNGDQSHADKPFARCPLCNGMVDQLHLETFNLGRRMNVRAQQRFCHEHRERDAERQREKNEYPTPDWPDVLGRRIRNHQDNLKSILLRSKPSYYRDHLDDSIEKARKSRKGVQKYLKEEIVDIAKHGYYGPKGARLIGHAITERMSDTLKETLKCDTVARAAGVGGYVNAVLVPELLMGLVMEDMHLDDASQARKILAESSDVGIMLNGDEEIVVQLEGEGEV